MKATTLFGLGALAAAGAAYAYKPARRVVFVRRDTTTELGLGLGALAVLIGGYQVAAGIDATDEKPAAPEVPMLPNVQPAPLAVPMKLEGDSITLEPGAIYAGAFDIPGVVNWSVTESRVRNEATKRGFVNVAVFKNAAPGWPGGEVPEDSDWLVIAMYAGEPKTIERPGELIEAWRT